MSSPAPQKDGKPPCKVVVLGLEGQPRGVLTAVGDRFNAEISRFYNASRQNSDNSREDVWHQHKPLPDGAGMLQYSSNQGQEVMTIRLSAKFVESVSEETAKSERTAWDWLVIELDTEFFKTIAGLPALCTMEVAARFWKPALKDIPDPESPDPDNPEPITGGASLERFALDDQGFNFGQQEPETAIPQDNPRLMFAGAPRAEQVGDAEVDNSEDIFRSSLLVDIRPNFWDDVIHIDLWANAAFQTVDKTLHTVVTHAVANPDNVNRVHAYYTGGSTGRTWVEDNFPAIASTVTLWTSKAYSYLNNYFIPQGYSASNGDDILTNNDIYGPLDTAPDLQTWYFNNSDIFNDPLWEQGYAAQWADVTPPYSWAGGGSWTSGGDMSAYLAQLDTMALPGDETFSGLLTGLGKRVYSIAGAEFWFQTEATDGFQFGGIGDPGTPPPDNYGDDGSAFARSFQFAAVRNTYIFQAGFEFLDDTPPVTTDCVIKAAALKGYFIDPPEDPESSDDAQLVWSRQNLTQAEDLYTAVTPSSTADVQFGQWEAKGDYPTRWDLQPIDGAEAVELTNSKDYGNPTTHSMINDLTYLGRVTFDQTGGGGSFAWTPAAEIEPDELPEMPA